MDKRINSYRFDLISEVTDIDPDTYKINITVKPDPRRYRWVNRSDGEYLEDMLDSAYFPKKLVFEMMREALSLPALYQPQTIGNATEYYETRKLVIEKLVDQRQIPFDPHDKSEEFLQSLTVDRLNFVIVSIDTAESTQLSTRMKQADFSFLMSLFSHEMAEIISHFHGHVLKYMGDGLIAYFPEPCFITMNDLAIDCACTMRGCVYRAINPVLVNHGLPKLDVRIGLDAGEAYIATMGNPKDKQHKDIIGAVVSLATKIQSIAQKGGINLGEVVHRHLHVAWRQACEAISVPSNWPYEKKPGEPYTVYRVTMK